jgi:hypothetical protein
MSDSSQELAPSASNNLRASALAERLEFYREAATTTHPDIRAHILKEMELDAEHRRSQQALAAAHSRKQETRLSPNVALVVCILAFLLAMGTIIYLHVALKIPLLAEPTGLCVFAALVISAIALLLSNALKPAEFLEMLRHAKGYIGFGKHAGQPSGEADINEQAHE